MTRVLNNIAVQGAVFGNHDFGELKYIIHILHKNIWVFETCCVCLHKF